MGVEISVKGKYALLGQAVEVLIRTRIIGMHRQNHLEFAMRAEIRQKCFQPFGSRRQKGGRIRGEQLVGRDGGYYHLPFPGSLHLIPHFMQGMRLTVHIILDICSLLCRYIGQHQGFLQCQFRQVDKLFLRGILLLG